MPSDFMCTLYVFEFKISQQNAYLHGNGFELYHVGKISSKHIMYGIHKAWVKYMVTFYDMQSINCFICIQMILIHTQHTVFLLVSSKHNIALFCSIFVAIEFNLNPNLSKRKQCKQ